MSIDFWAVASPVVDTPGPPPGTPGVVVRISGGPPQGPTVTFGGLLPPALGGGAGTGIAPGIIR
jgi:hypothetical protein